ncbi:DUF481 domain-containing protein [Pontibacter cellulosilyticus]|uniref:DUF481 domain-containing protein n=1 Tax=Pontibacter cellulosilyticus TaxID=1720253 RepID=A0A923N6W1_9BACT|nr:DUF481 domain-containing protein [Pontibacter cellulosilyticus]MBC5991595.1 DUF481 domain-containing protein [Pontibacter cellulosilyticus]
MTLTIKCFFLIISIVFVCSSYHEANAQILNIERSRVSQDTVNYLTGKVGANFSMFNRNAGKNNPNNYLQLTFTGDLAYISGKHSYLLLNYYNYLLVNYDSRELRNTVASTGYSHLRANLHRKRKLSYELFAQAQADKARGLELRTLLGGGVRLALLRENDFTLYFGTGVMHEHEEWEKPEQDQILVVSDLPKSTNYISAKAKLSEHISTDGIAYYQVGYDRIIDDFRNRISGDVSLNFKVNSKFSFRTNFNCVFEDEPIVPVTRFVYAISNGVQVNF